ncbi:MAG: FMN-binding glutamate synthase family protein [Phycisphaerales bacterium]|nr:FMN-binding glutamate synthase family protein [Phycisphaerales bacterium]
MFRHWFFAIAAVLVALIAVIAVFWPPVLWSLIIIAPLVLLGLYDSVQTRHTIRRNFPLIGHLRYLFESLRPEIQQYFIELNTDAYPIEREVRSLVYQRAKGELETQPFGTQHDVNAIGYEWVAHALVETQRLEHDPRVEIGTGRCAKPYSASHLNISAMSYGSLSPHAIEALSRGARMGNFAHNTGEGAISPYHLRGGGDLIWQIGTGYFGCRNSDGGFDDAVFSDNASQDHVRMIEIKLSQGAKPGHGGVLPGVKVNKEIAEIRGVPQGQTVVSPPRHSTFNSPKGLLEFVEKLREHSGGKPVGFKLCIGRRVELLGICKAIIETGMCPDFITVDGGEGGTGAAPLEFSNSVGMPARDAWAFAHNALVGAGLRDRVKIIASGKIMTGFHMIRAMALGADLCNSARGMMLALGCIQALRCNNDTCPTGVATQNKALYKGLVIEDKAPRVQRFHQATISSMLELLSAIGVDHPSRITPDLIFRRISEHRISTFEEAFEFLDPDVLVNNGPAPDLWRREWERANADSFAVAPA